MVSLDFDIFQFSLTPDDGLTTRNISKSKLTIVLFYFYVKPTSQYYQKNVFINLKNVSP